MEIGYRCFGSPVCEAAEDLVGVGSAGVGYGAAGALEVGEHGGAGIRHVADADQPHRIKYRRIDA